MSKAPQYAHLLSNTLPTTTNRPRAHLYRSFLQHLRLLPDPHIWNVLIPPFRKACEQLGPNDASRSVKFGQEERENTEWTFERKAAALAVSRQHRKVKRLHKKLAQRRAAVACHPHALTRLFEEAYAQRGSVRYQLIQHIAKTSKPSDTPRANEHLLGPARPPLPAPLLPLCPRPVPPENISPRARTYIPPNAGKRKAIAAWHRDWHRVKVPIVLPQRNDPYSATGWEGRGIVEALQSLAGVDRPAGPRTLPRRAASEAVEVSSTQPNDLPTFSNLSPTLQRIFPIKLQPTLREPPEPVPPPRMTRANPGAWNPPVLLDARILRRTYARLWASLAWVRPEGDGWGICTYREMTDYEADLIAEREGDSVKNENDRPGVGRSTKDRVKKGKKGKKGAKGKFPEFEDLGKWSVGSAEDRRWLQ